MTDSTAGSARLIDALAQVAFTTMAVLNAAASDNELSLTQLRAIEILRDRTLRMSDLAGYLGLEKSTMSGLVVRAEKRGLLRRVADADDARAVLVTIAPAGHELAARVRVTVTQALAPLLGGLDAVDSERLGELLEQMLAAYRPGGA